MRRVIAALTATLFSIPCAADEWRIASVEEIVASWGGAFHNAPTNEVAGDFDGNGVLDTARIMRSSITGRLELFVAMNEGAPSYQLLRLHPMNELGIELVQPGTYKTLCGKGYDCPEGGPLTMTLEWPGLGVFKPESASWVMYWDTSSQNFKEFGISD